MTICFNILSGISRNRIFAYLITLFVANNVFAMTYRDNVVEMPLKVNNYSIVSATYVVNSYSVTSGQDPDGEIYTGLTKSYAGSNGSMTFRVGRKGSDTVAKWFTSRIPGSRTTFGYDPGKLNFAFIGTLTLKLSGGVLGANADTYILENIGIAQGHTFGRNNWWFGGKNCENRSENRAACNAKSSSGHPVEFTFHRGGNGVNEISLVDIIYEPFRQITLGAQYRDEDKACVWYVNKCPPYVVYLNNLQKEALKLSVANNMLYDSDDFVFSTLFADPSSINEQKVAIFVMSTDGTLYASPAHKVGMFHHSSIVSGGNVAAAGEMVVKNGVIDYINNCSGHYRGGAFQFDQIKESLKRQGYTDSSYTIYDCSDISLTY